MYEPPAPSASIPVPKKKGLQLSREPASSHSRRATMTIRGIEEEIIKATNKLDECERCKITNEQIIQMLEYKLLLLRSDPKNTSFNIYDSHPLSQGSLRQLNKTGGRRKGRTKKKGKRKKRKTRRRR